MSRWRQPLLQASIILHFEMHIAFDIRFGEQLKGANPQVDAFVSRF
ncbi:hypothetical protein [Paenibacillus sp. NPDC058174]